MKFGALRWGLLLAGVAAAATAQGPEADWRTVETAHFRVHYPAASEAWSLRLAARLESVREAVGREVGYTPAQSIDVVIADPAATANGSAWPLLPAPRIVLWTTPPEAGSGLAHLTDWGELVAVHELAHLAHLLRPSRQPFRALLERTLWPLAPLATKAPRWATEGYATLIEGRLTGSGRPHSALRASVIRLWARAGRLPGYAQLADDRDSFLGSSMAYLVGSAFLEWAESGSGDPRALARLWAAATARRDRSFDAAWERVFGEMPRVAYARFVAEAAADAVAAERRLGGDAREGEIWLERRWSTGEPQVSPDGRELAAILREREAPARLVVWPLAEPAPAAVKPRPPEDPEDPARAPLPPRRRAAARTLEAPAGRELLAARYFADGRRLLVTLLAPDRRGIQHTDLYLWQQSGKLARLTRGADLRDADPAPDGRRAIAVRWRDGASQLVEVDLASGLATPLGEPGIDVVQDSPRFAPDGASLAWLEHRDGRWRAVVAPYSSASGLGPARELAVGESGEPTHLAWRGDGSLLYAAIARGEAIEIEALAVAAGAASHLVTRSPGASFAPAPTPDGKRLFYLSLAPDGVDLRRLDLDAATVQELPPPAATADAVAPAARLFAATPVGAPRRYGLGRGVIQPVAGGWGGSEPGSFELGARAGDLLGRWELIALAGFAGDEGRRGGALRSTLQLLPIALELDLARLRLGEREATAVRIAVGRDDIFGAGDLRWSAAAGWNRDSSTRSSDLTVAQLGFDTGLTAQRGHLSLTTRLAGETTSALDSSDSLHHLRLGLRLAHPGGSLSFGAATWRTGRRAPPELVPSLGGMPSSLAPPTLEPGRIDLPALPAAALSGRRLDRLELRAAAKRLPATAVLQRFRSEGAGGARSELRLVGLERSWKLPPLPLVGLPAAEARLGVARLSGDLGERSTRWWIGIVLPLPR